MNLKTIALLFVTCIIASCSDKPEIAAIKTNAAPAKTDSVTGGVKILSVQTQKGPFKIWTKTVGNNPSVKLLLLNGGPGCTHEYFEGLAEFLPQQNIEIIYYDQLGCGNSDNPNDTAMWSLARYVDEVEQIRKQLNLDSSNFYLLGHSWGGIVAMEYAVQHQQNLKGLIISNMMCDAVEYGKYADEVLAKQMDKAVLKEIRSIEKKKDFDNPRYMQLLKPHFYEQHICRIPEKNWPEPMKRSFDKMNSSLYVTMQGPSEFGISGKLTNWTRKADMNKITVPTLVIGAKYDTMDPEHMKWMSQQVKNGTFLYCENGSHMCMWDDQQTYMNGLISFLKNKP